MPYAHGRFLYAGIAHAVCLPAIFEKPWEGLIIFAPKALILKPWKRVFDHCSEDLIWKALGRVMLLSGSPDRGFGR
jgi:hypothetical protein